MMNKHAVWILSLWLSLTGTFGCVAQTNDVSQGKAAGQASPVGESNMVKQSGAPAPDRTPRFAHLGDAAPRLTILEWIKGKPLRIQPGTNIYVLVFCNLTQANDFALTNLSALQAKYQDKGVIVVAISPESPDQLRAFVQVRGGDVDFTVAADDQPGRTAKNYLMIFGQVQLPRAYIVGQDGKVLWYGHPLREGMGQVVDDIVSGHYNLDQIQKNITTRDELEHYLLMASRDDPQQVKAGRMLLSVRTNDAPGLCALASKIATDPTLEKRDVALATEALDRAAQLTTTNATDITVTRAILLFQTGKKLEGLALAKQALAAAKAADDKDEAQICIRAMEGRIAMEKNSQPNAPASQPKP